MFDEIQYQEALDYLYIFVDYSLTRNFRYTADKFDLGRMRELMALSGDPQNCYPVIHVAGTKGKGSTAAIIASVLQAAGLRVGFYTSPHLQDYCERIQVNRAQISHEDFTALVAEIKPLVAKVEQLTTFELTTALGFLYFARQACDVAVVEGGLGGRLGATNIVDPLVSGITSLSMDHMNVLGDTLAKIAFEKAGIIKPGKPVVLAPQREEARVVVERVAEERHAPLVRVGQDYLFAPWTHSLDGQTLMVWRAEEQALVDQFVESGGQIPWEPLRLRIPLLGYHQVQNAATAYAAFQVAREAGLPVTIVPHSTLRDPDGLAMSSRNRFLSATERAAALPIPQALERAAAIADAASAQEAMARLLAAAGLKAEYAVVRDGASLTQVSAGSPDRSLIAAWAGGTGLIDNAPWPGKG